MAKNSSVDDDQLLIDEKEEVLEDDLEAAICLSLKNIEDDKKRQKLEDTELEKVIKISLIEK